MVDHRREVEQVCFFLETTVIFSTLLLFFLICFRFAVVFFLEGGLIASMDHHSSCLRSFACSIVVFRAGKVDQLKVYHGLGVKTRDVRCSK